MILYLDTVTGEEVHQIDAYHGDWWEIGGGSTWIETAKNWKGTSKIFMPWFFIG